MQNRMLARVLAMALAAAVVAPGGAAVMPAMAVMAVEGDQTPGATTPEVVKKSISVTGVEVGATVTAYQVVKGNYTEDKSKLTGYELTELGKDITVTGKTTAVDLSDLVKYVPATETTPASGENNTALLAAWTAAVANRTTEEAYATKLGTPTRLTEGTASDGKAPYEADVEPGLYVVVVTKSNTATVYNPVLLAVNVSDANNVSTSASGTTVAINTAFQNGTTTAYMKSSTSGFDKNIVCVMEGDASGTKTTKKTTDNPDGKSKGDAVAIGDTVEFQIDGMTIPSYSDDYVASLQYKISDTLESTAFGPIKNIVVKVDGAVVEAGSGADANYVLTEKDGTTAYSDQTSKTFMVAFTDKFIRDHALKSVQVNYKSTLATTAGLNYAENVNQAQLDYSNDPTNESNVYTEKANTYHYTFGIDANIDAEATETTTGDKKWETHELNKVTKASGESAFVETTTTYSQTGATSTKYNGTYKLPGAEFGLYTDANCTTAAKALITTNGVASMQNAVATSDANGHITFLGLDEGTYYLKETKAPADYTLSTKIYKIIIDGTFDETTGVMKSYSIKTYDTSDNNKEVGSATYTNTADLSKAIDDNGNVTNVISKETTITPLEIVNTKIQDLPFTGGEGRKAIYIGGGIAVAVIVILLIIRSRLSRER